MHWQYHPFLWPLVVAAAISIGLSLFAWRRRWAPGAVPFTLLMLAVAWWSVGYALELGSADLEAKVIWYTSPSREVPKSSTSTIASRRE